MLDKAHVTEKMKERGFIVYAHLGNSSIHFVSERMYDTTYADKVPKRERIPVINITVDLEKDQFECVYNLDKSITTLKTPPCGPVMSDTQFDKIVSRFESEAKWISRLSE